ADPLDFPFQLDAGIFFDTVSHGLTQGLDVGRGGRAAVDQKITVQLRDLRVANNQATAYGGIAHLPSLTAGWILEGRTAGAALDRLRRLTRFCDLVHGGGDGGRDARRSGERRPGGGEIPRPARRT